MKQSETIGALAKALVAVQKNVTPIVKDRTNPHFNAKFASLDGIMEQVRPLLAGEGLSIVQGGAGPVSNNDGNICGVSVETMLLHQSGEFVSSIIVLPLEKPSAQAVGSAVTYGRRYGVAALLALTTEDDDDGQVATANAVNAAPRAAQAPKPATPATGTTQALLQQESAAEARDEAGPMCPKCSGDLWDNRAENDARLAKGEKLRPDYKCRDNACAGVVWRPKAAA